MPHASCASLAESHGTPRLQARRQAKSFDIGLTLSCYLGFYLPALARKSSNRRIALVPSLSLFGVSAVLGATVSGSLHRWPRLPLHSSFQHSSLPFGIGNKPAGMGLHEWPLAWRGRVGIVRFYRLTPAYLTGSCPQKEIASRAGVAPAFALRAMARQASLCGFADRRLSCSANGMKVIVGAKQDPNCE